MSEVNNGIQLYSSGQYTAALQFFLQDDAQHIAERSYYLGLCYTQLGNSEEALIHLDEFIEQLAQRSEASQFSLVYQTRMLIGYIYATTKRYRLAEFEFSKLLDEGFDSSKVRAALGYIFYMQGNIPASVKNLEKSREMDPQNATALNSLAYIMAEENVQIPLALKYIRQALHKNPRSPSYLDTLGWLLYKNGERGKSRQVLKKALEIASKEKKQESYAYQDLKNSIREHINTVQA